MSRITLLGTWTICATLALACESTSRTDAEREQGRNIDIAEAVRISETGCLTASGNRYALTALETGGIAETELYQLIGQEDELRQHVGREVRVVGDAEPPQIADVREISPATPAGTSGAEGDQPQVQTQTQTRLETRRLRVTSVTPTGDECESATR
jgi:hypothetical protein